MAHTRDCYVTSIPSHGGLPQSHTYPEFHVESSAYLKPPWTSRLWTIIMEYCSLNPHLRAGLLVIIEAGGGYGQRVLVLLTGGLVLRAQSNINHAERTGGQQSERARTSGSKPSRSPRCSLCRQRGRIYGIHRRITNLQAEVQPEGERQDDAGRHGGQRHGPHSPSPTRFHHGANKFRERPVEVARVPAKRLAVPHPSRTRLQQAFEPPMQQAQEP